MTQTRRGLVRRIRGNLAARVLKIGINREFKLKRRAKRMRGQYLRQWEILCAHSQNIHYYPPISPARKAEAKKTSAKLDSRMERTVDTTNKLEDKAIRTRKVTKALARRLAGKTKK